jgi:hypothetical protein
MILLKDRKETDSFLSVNNDIYRIITVLNKNQELKKLLIHTDSKPLQGVEVNKDLRDKQISRAPLLPYDEEEGSLVVVTMINGDIDPKSTTMLTTLAIDVFTPGNQWIISEGIRPLQIAHAINNLMKDEMKQTDGVKYRLTSIINSQLSDILLGYRMIYETVIDE